jgi:glycosyltransferase involved in cell wall biosynthesis
MKILISISSLNIGGAQTFAVRLAKGLSQKKHSVYLYNYEYFCNPELDYQLLKNQNSDEKTEGLLADLKILAYPPFLEKLAENIDKILYKIGSKSRVKKLFKRFHFQAITAFYRIDIVNSHLYHSDQFVTHVLQNSSIPIILSDHGDYRYVVEKKTASLAEVDRIVQRVNGIVYPSYSNAQNFSRYTINSQAINEVIYLGIFPGERKNYSESAREKLKIPESSFVFGMVARGIPEKGWSEAIQAFTLACNLTEKELHLILVGDSEHLSTLRQSLDAKLNSKIHFVGYSSEPNYWIDSFDIGLLPTYFLGESLPMSIIEYLSLGKPVIATNVGGISEMIAYQKQQAGAIVDLTPEGKANVNSMVQAMLRYVNNPELLKQHSSLAKQAFEKFKIEQCLENYESLFKKVLTYKSNPKTQGN